MAPVEVVAAQLEYGVSAREAADRARSLVGSLAERMPPGSRIAGANGLRILVEGLQCQAVMVELATGSTWREVARALDLPVRVVVDALRKRGSPLRSAALRGSELTLISDARFVYGDGLVDTAASLDAWFARHAEPWEEPVEDAISRIFGAG